MQDFFRCLQQTMKTGQNYCGKYRKGILESRRYQGIPGLKVYHVKKEEFDHGGTRNLAAWYSDADIMIFMTDDAVPQDEHLIERLTEAFDKKGPEERRCGCKTASGKGLPL